MIVGLYFCNFHDILGLFFIVMTFLQVKTLIMAQNCFTSLHKDKIMVSV